MRMRKSFALVLVVLACSSVFTNVFGQEKKYELNTASDIKDVLKENIGKIVYIKLGSGEELNGWVVKVGDHLVHIAKLPGRDFYDAVIRVDRISAVIFKVRGNRKELLNNKNSESDWSVRGVATSSKVS